MTYDRLQELGHHIIVDQKTGADFIQIFKIVNGSKGAAQKTGKEMYKRAVEWATRKIGLDDEY